MGKLIQLNQVNSSYPLAIRLQQVNLKIDAVNRQVIELLAIARQPYDASIHGSLELYRASRLTKGLR